MERIPNLRKLAAIDIYLLGFKVVFAEYVFGVLFSLVLGVFVMFRSSSVWQVALGLYLVCMGMNYVPLFLYTLSIANRQNAQLELGDELMEKRQAMSKYRRLSLLLLVPLVLPVVAIAKKRLNCASTGN